CEKRRFVRISENNLIKKKWMSEKTVDEANQWLFTDVDKMIYNRDTLIPLPPKSRFYIGQLVRLNKHCKDLALINNFDRTGIKSIRSRTECFVLDIRSHSGNTILTVTPKKNYLKKIVDIYDYDCYPQLDQVNFRRSKN